MTKNQYITHITCAFERVLFLEVRLASLFEGVFGLF